MSHGASGGYFRSVTSAANYLSRPKVFAKNILLFAASASAPIPQQFSPGIQRDRHPCKNGETAKTFSDHFNSA
jgi:hypothetical protein